MEFGLQMMMVYSLVVHSSPITDAGDATKLPSDTKDLDKRWRYCRGHSF